MRKILVISWLIVLLSAIGALFWYNDWVYQLPTPVPVGYKSVGVGQLIALKEPFGAGHEKPVFLHFFNPDCPCSKFNIKHFKSLVRQYGSQVDFKVVVLSSKPFTSEAVQARFDLHIPVLFDPSLAKVCGVYSTPQAVLLDKSRHLYYRGNYNSSRYCTDEKTSYAKIALNGLLKEQTNLVFSELALKSYGCKLPDCKN